MAPMGAEEVEYESDPDEVKRSLAMRRQEASDDEEGEVEGKGVGEDDGRKMNRTAVIHSDESDGQGGAAEYDDDEDELGVDDEYEDEEEYYEGEEEVEEAAEEEAYDGREYRERNEENGRARGTEGPSMKELEGDGRRKMEEVTEGHAAQVEEEEEKEKQPFAVPTAGAFYMHDDRFRDNAGGRHRRMHGGRQLWESKDDRKWGHDKFEEVNMQERHYEERRTSRGRYHGRGRHRGPDRSYGRGGKSKAFYSNDDQNQAPKVVTRGRGPRRYETVMKSSSQAPSVRNRKFGKSLEKTSHTDSAVGRMPTANSATAIARTKKHAFASSLSSASPPFYPSGSSSNLEQKKDTQAGIDQLHIKDSTSVSGKTALENQKTAASLQVPSSGSSFVSPAQSSKSRAHGRGASASGQVNYQPVPPHNQVNRVSSPAQLHAVQKGTVQNRVQPSAQAPSQQSGQHSVSRSLASPPKTASSVSSHAEAEVKSASEAGALVGKGKGSLQAGGRGSFLCSGTQVMGTAGNLAIGHGDQNFPTFLPVMQFGGQHPGGMGVTALGMAFPGYVAQSQLGLGNSEMTWLPVLAGAGALGATYCPSYAVDGSYHARPTGQPSSAGSSSKENNANKPSNESNPLQRSELVKDELPQRQNNPNKHPRRYSEMSFSK